MHLARASLTGIVYMVLANGSITINNALIKLAVVELPPMQAMFLRAIAAVLLGLPVLAATHSLASLRHIVAPRVLVRSLVRRSYRHPATDPGDGALGRGAVLW